MPDINPRPLQWTNVDAPQPAKESKNWLYGDDGTPTHSVDFPTKRHPWPDNAIDPIPALPPVARWTLVDTILAGALVMVLAGAGYMLVGN